MPTQLLPVRYRSPYGVPNVLTPPDSELPGFDPDADQVQNLSLNSYAPDETPLPDAPGNAAQALGTPSPLPPDTPNGANKKFKLPPASMAPPEPVEAPPQPPPSSPAPSPAASASAPAGAPQLPPQQIGSLDESVATGPGNPINAGVVADQPQLSASDKLATLHNERPEAPKSNLAQRIANAVISVTKLAPMANMLVHPKYSEQMAAYQGSVADAERQQKEEEQAASTEAQVELKEATAAQKRALGASYEQTQDTRRNSANDRLEAAFEKAMGPDAVPLNPGEQPPAGFAVFTNPLHPEQKWIRRSPVVQLPPELAHEFPGMKAGDPITRKEIEAGMASVRSKEMEHIKAGDKPVTNMIELQQKINSLPDGDPQRVQLQGALDAEQKRQMQLRSITHVNVNAGASPGDADDIAQGIIDGTQPPTLQGLYRMGAPVRAKLARQGYDLVTAQRDWEAVKRHMATLNGQQQERLRQAITFTHDSLGQIEDLYSQWQKVGPASGFKILNRAALAGAKQLPGQTGAIAKNLEAQINDLTSELGTVYKGGNASTDESLRLAAENLKADWNEETFKMAIQQIRKNLNIRKNSILTSEPAGVSPDSPYVSHPQGAPSSTPGATPQRKPLNEIFK